MSAFMLQQPLLLCRFDLFYIQLWSILLSTLHILSSAIYKRRTMRSARPQCTRLTKFFIFSLSAPALLHIITQHRVLHILTQRKVLQIFTQRKVLHILTQNKVLHIFTPRKVLHIHTQHKVLHILTQHKVLHILTQHRVLHNFKELFIWHFFILNPVIYQFILYSFTFLLSFHSHFY